MWRKSVKTDSCHILVLFPLKNVTNTVFSGLTERKKEGSLGKHFYLSVAGLQEIKNKTVNFRSGWYFKLKAASILTNGLLLQKRAATAALRGFAILGSPFQWWPYRLFLYPSSCVALLYSMFHRTPEDLLWRLALRNAVEFVLGEKNELICCMVGTEDSQEWL